MSTPSHRWYFEGEGMQRFRYGSPPAWTLTATDEEPPMHFCTSCGGDLLPPVADLNAVQVCGVCGSEQPEPAGKEQK